MGRHVRPRAAVSPPTPELTAFLHEHSLAAPDEKGDWHPLSGGVSSDIWRIETSRGTYCIKRALARLRVAALWEAPVERNAFEWAYMQAIQAIAPGAVPRPIAHDPERGLFAMAWLGPDRHSLWKTELLAGRVDPSFAASVGDLLGRIHAATARDSSLPARFATDDNFRAIRLDPYLLETARLHPDLAPRIEAIVTETAQTRHVLVHGDVSPKNILIGPAGPVLLDAEVAWFGDPAFDLAFCLNHLAVKARVVPDARDPLRNAFRRLVEAYSAHIDWEPPAELQRRAAALLPTLALARVDGKSPLEYLDERQRDALRADARNAILAQPATLEEALHLLTEVA